MILIPNTKFPKCCEDCPCDSESYCRVLCKGIDCKEEDVKRRDDCPLMEVDFHITKPK